MKTLFENVIKRGGYDLTEMLAKIDTYHIEGKLTDKERDALYEMARGSQVSQYDLKTEVEKLWYAVKELQKLHEEPDTEEDTEEGEEEGTEEVVYPEFVQPTGAHDAYMTGDTVTYNGKIYTSKMDYNVYSPDVYPTGWKEIEG